MRRQLTLKPDPLTGEDIKEVQRKLGMRGAAIDGVFGPKTADRVQEWKWEVGYPKGRINSVLGLPGLGLLFGEIEFPSDFKRRARERRGKTFLPTMNGIARPLDTPVPRYSEFAYVDPRDDVGAPDDRGVKHHGGLDWRAPAGALVRAPVAGKVAEARRSDDTKGQVYGGTLKIKAADGKLWTLRHVAPSASVGTTIRAGQPVATVAQWDDGPEHVHIEIWKTPAGGYDYENMLDPLPFFKN